MFFRFDYAIAAIYIGWLLFSSLQNWSRRRNNAQQRLDEMRRYEVGFGTPSESTLRAMQSGSFHEIEEEFAVLGFHVLGDYVVAGGVHKEVPLDEAPLASPFGGNTKQEFRFAYSSACRVLAHDQHRCIASIAAPLSALSHEKLERRSINFLIASAGQGWTYSSSADLPLLVDFESAARDLISFEGPLLVAELLKLHLARRAEVARAGNFEWEVPLTLEKIIAWETQRYARVRDWAKDRSPSALLRAERRGRRHPRYDLLGDLEGKL